MGTRWRGPGWGHIPYNNLGKARRHPLAIAPNYGLPPPPNISSMAPLRGTQCEWIFSVYYACVCGLLCDRSTRVVAVGRPQLARVNEKITWRRHRLWPVPHERQSSVFNDAQYVHVPRTSRRSRPLRWLPDEAVSSCSVSAPLQRRRNCSRVDVNEQICVFRGLICPASQPRNNM